MLLSLRCVTKPFKLQMVLLPDLYSKDQELQEPGPQLKGKPSMLEVRPFQIARGSWPQMIGKSGKRPSS